MKSAGLHVFALFEFIICLAVAKSVAWEGCAQNRTEVARISIQNLVLHSTKMHNFACILGGVGVLTR